MSQDSEPGTPEPRPDPVVAAPAGTSRSRQLRLAALLVVLLVVAVAVARVVTADGPPTRDELRRRAGLVDKQTLLIGVKDDQPGISQLREDGSYQGFDIDIATMIAEDLGFDESQIRFLPMESEDRARRQARDDREFVTVDLVIASYSITEARIKQGVTFSAPYLSTEQSVVTLKSDTRRVDSLRDLRGRKVCTLSTSTSENRLRDFGAEAHGKNRISECIQELYDGTVDAVTTDAAILAGFVAHRPGDPWPASLRGEKPLRHWDIGEDPSELWGINTGPNTALRDLVDLSLYASAKDPGDRDWEEAYTRNLRWEQPANLPQQVAIGRQPEPRKVEVRQWPWERVALPPPGRPGPAAQVVARVRGRRSSGC